MHKLGGDAYIHQAETRHGFLPFWEISRTKGTSRTTWIDKESTLQLKCLESMRASPQKNIDVHLSGRNEQCIGIAGRDYGVAMGESDAQTSMRHNFR